MKKPPILLLDDLDLKVNFFLRIYFKANTSQQTKPRNIFVWYYIKLHMSKDTYYPILKIWRKQFREIHLSIFFIILTDFKLFKRRIWNSEDCLSSYSLEHRTKKTSSRFVSSGQVLRFKFLWTLEWNWLFLFKISIIFDLFSSVMLKVFIFVINGFIGFN